MKRPIARACAGLALAACVAMLAATFAIAQQSSGPSDPLEYFAEMMPVFTHDRCTGCHGRVNPELATGNNHSMGQFTDSGIRLECHTEAPRWKTRPDLAFINKTTKQLCQMQSAEVEHIRNSARTNSVPIAQADAEYLRHLSGDNLIGAAFIGKAAGALGRANPPRMNRTEFVAAGKAWLEVGAGCGGWEGEITQTETFGSNYEYPMLGGGSGTTQVTETAGREIKIKRINGVTTGTFTMSGHQTIVQTMLLDGCSAVTTSVGEWTSTTPPESHVGFRVHVDDDGGYTILFKGPKETTKSSSQGHMVNDCGLPVFADPEEPPIELEWSPWVFTIRCPSDHAICQIFDPDNKRLSGTMERVIMDHSDAHEPQSRLTVSLAGISRGDDGAPLPVRVTTTWDLALTD